MTKIIIGVDPGGKGSLAVDWGDKIEVFRFHRINERLDECLPKILEDAKGRDIFAYIEDLEKAGKRPINGTKATWGLGKKYGEVLMAFRILKIPFDLVGPQKWQAIYSLPKFKATEGATKEQRAEAKKRFSKQHKKDLYQKAKDLYPEYATSEDKADSLLIMRYGVKNENI